jgi:hypothetical protein
MILLLLLLASLPEDVLFETEQEIDFELILRDLEYLKGHPLDINSVETQELARIPFLTLNTVIKIIEYRKRRGPFKELDDLLQIPGIDKALVEAISPYLMVGVKKVEVKKIRIRARLEDELPVHELSSKYHTRVNAVIDDYGIYAVTEKDAYEQAFFDHYAVGLLIDGGSRKFAFGKYNLDLGAGALLSSVGSFFRGVDFRLMMNERGLVPYTSTIENGGFFGAAFSDSFFVKYTVFYSSQKLDGRIDSLGYAQSLDASGAHIDSLSLSRKDRITEEILGYDLRYRNENMVIASRSYLCNYAPVFSSVDSVAKFYGDGFLASSVELRYFGESFVTFGELSRSWQNRMGGLFGFSAVFPYVDFTVAGKYFPAGFYSPKGIEATPNSAAGTIDLKHHSRLIDVGLSLTLDNKVDEDTGKYDIRLNLEKRLGIASARINLQYRFRGEERDMSGSDVLMRITPVKFLFLDLRFEQKSIYEETTESGIFWAVEFGLDLERIDARFRYGIFDTDSYGSRIYAYEIDLPGIVNNRMLYNKGEYGFVYVSLRPIHAMKLGFKYSVVRRDENHDKKVGGQIDFSL